jgi:hypothetical protein
MIYDRSLAGRIFTSTARIAITAAAAIAVITAAASPAADGTATA